MIQGCVFDIPSDLTETMLSQWKNQGGESLEMPSELPELLQKQRHSLGSRGAGGGWRKQFHGGSRSGQSRDFNRNGMLKRRASWNAGTTQNRRKTFD